jgi:hypothetical protein
MDASHVPNQGPNLWTMEKPEMLTSPTFVSLLIKSRIPGGVSRELSFSTMRRMADGDQQPHKRSQAPRAIALPSAAPFSWDRWNPKKYPATVPSCLEEPRQHGVQAVAGPLELVRTRARVVPQTRGRPRTARSPESPLVAKRRQKLSIPVKRSTARGAISDRRRRDSGQRTPRCREATRCA